MVPNLRELMVVANLLGVVPKLGVVPYLLYVVPKLGAKLMGVVPKLSARKLLGVLPKLDAKQLGVLRKVPKQLGVLPKLLDVPKGMVPKLKGGSYHFHVALLKSIVRASKILWLSIGS